MQIERHWWNGDATPRGRRDVLIRSNGEWWEVEARIGGASGKFRVQECPTGAAAAILAEAWRGGGRPWLEQKDHAPAARR